MGIHTSGVRMDEKLPPRIIGPAPKEEGMEPKLDRWIPCKNRSCTEERYGTGDPILCNICSEKRATELRAVYREAYMAALPVCLREAHARDEDVQSVVREVGLYALETVRQWPAMMAELEQEIAK